MLASDILNDVRSFVNDTGKKRYSDADLLRLLNEGLLDLSTRLRIFKSEVSIPFAPGVAVYNLPLDFIEFQDIAVNGEEEANRFTYTQIAREAGDSWRTETIDKVPSSIIYNKESLYQYRAYPIPTGENLYNLFLDNEEESYGIVTFLDGYSSPDDYGQITYADIIANKVSYAPGGSTGSSGNNGGLQDQVNLLAGQVSQYSQIISSNSVAIEQLTGLVASATTTANSAYETASGAVNTLNALTIRVDAAEGDIDNIASSVSTISSQLSTTTALANSAGTTATNALNTANAALSTANTAKSRLDNTGGGVSIETLATNVTALTASVSQALSTANSANTAAGAATSAANTALSVANSAKARLDNTGNGVSIESLASNVTALSSSVTSIAGTANSALNIANTANSKADTNSSSLTALASTVTTLSATTATNTATIEVHADAIAALESTTASWQVSSTVNGLTNGFGIWNDGTTERVVFRTNHLQIYPTSGNTGQLAFAVESGVVVIPNANITNIIQSSNYVANVSGWMIRKSDGYAEFGNVRVRGDVQATSLNAATGTFSGSLTSAAVNAVNTINLADQSVVIDVMSYDANIRNFSYTDTGFTIATKSITMNQATANSSIGISANFRISSGLTANGADPGTMTFRVVRDGITLATFTRRIPFYAVSTGGPGDPGNKYDVPIIIDFMDQPGAGTFNYQIQYVSQTLYSGSIYNINVSEAFLRLSGGKK